MTQPVQIEAFISPDVPEAYVQTRLNLLADAAGVEVPGGDKVQVEIHDTDRFSDEAALAEDRYGIEPHQVASLNNGVLNEDYIFLGVAVKCGAGEGDPAVLRPRHPASNTNWSARSATVTQQKRKKVGVLETDAKLFGGFNMQTHVGRPRLADHRRIEETVRRGPGRSQPSRSPSATTCCWPCSLRRWGRRR